MSVCTSALGTREHLRKSGHSGCCLHSLHRMGTVASCTMHYRTKSISPASLYSRTTPHRGDHTPRLLHTAARTIPRGARTNHHSRLHAALRVSRGRASSRLKPASNSCHLVPHSRLLPVARRAPPRCGIQDATPATCHPRHVRPLLCRHQPSACGSLPQSR